MLETKIPGTRRRQSGLGRICFPLLFSFLSELLFQVICISQGFPGGSSRDPLHFRCLENHATTLLSPEHEHRSSTATARGNDLLKRCDEVMANAFDRFYKESGDKKKAAVKVKEEEKEFAASLWLVNEQGGFGMKDGMGFDLFEKTRDKMLEFVKDVSLFSFNVLGMMC